MIPVIFNRISLVWIPNKTKKVNLYYFDFFTSFFVK